jgi:hypothetical protein
VEHQLYLPQLLQSDSVAQGKLGDQRSKFSQVEVAPLGAQTTQPVTQPTHTTQVVQQSTFDPVTGQPVTQLTQEVQAVNQPVTQPVQPAGAFDPATGQPVPQNTGFQSEANTSPVRFHRLQTWWDLKLHEYLSFF